MEQVASAAHRQLASRMRELIARRQAIELLIQVGEYAAGSDPLADEAIARHAAIEAFLRQPAAEHDTLAQTLAHMRKVLA